MGSRLDRIDNWSELAAKAGYEPATMAALAPASLRQLERYFAKKFGTTPRNWARQAQGCKARELIQRGYSNKATAITLGYTNESEFCRIFKQVWGVPPQHFSPVHSPSLSLVQDNVVRSQSMELPALSGV